MYKNYTWNPGTAKKLRHKILLYMRLTTVIILASLLQVSAATFGQKINLSESNVTLKSILKEIRRQSKYDFYYDGKLVPDNQKVSVYVKDATLQEALNTVLNGLDLFYDIEGNTVSILKRVKQHSTQNKSNQKAIDVRGRIVDNEGRPLPGATIRVVGTNNVTLSNANGEFMLKDVAADAILDVSFTGFTTKRLPAGANLGTIALEVSNNNLQEVVVNTGFQSIQKEKLTGATVTITSKELEKRYTPNILTNLEGRVPGLVNYRGTTTIRGVSTFNNGARSPLYVVDGLPIEGSVANINPYDVETITVLKDAAAAAIYGVRASNGVVVITTKKANQNGTTIEFATDVTLTDKTDYDKFNLLTAAQQVDVENAYTTWLFTNPTSGPANITTYNNQINQGLPVTPIVYLNLQLAQNLIPKSQVDAALAQYRQNDFRKEFAEKALRNQLLQQYNFAVRTGSDKFQSSLLLNYKTDNNAIANAYNRQLNIFYKGTYMPLKWATIDFGINTVLGKAKESNSNFATSPLNVPSYLRLEDADGNRQYYTTADYNQYTTVNNSTIPQLQSMLVNHLDELEKDIRNTRQNFGRYFVNLKVNIIDGLTFSPQFQYENNSTTARTYSESDSYAMRYLRNSFTTRAGTAPNYTYTYLTPQGGRLATIQQNVDAWTARGQLDYIKQFKKHEINVLAGMEFRENLTKGSRGLLLGYDDQLQSQSMNTVNFAALSTMSNSTFFKPGINPSGVYSANIGNFIGVVPETRSRSNSVYANATYTYDSKYNVFGSFRKDYADAFGLDKKFRGRPLWSTGVSWNAHNEDFIKSQPWINFLKLRATYGITGNIAPGLTSLLVANSAVPANAATQLPVSEIQSSANPQLRWEKTATANIGIDFTLFQGRMNGALDIYRKRGSDILAATRIDPSEGFLSQIINNGDLLNNGIELNLQYQWFKPSKASGFGWSSNLVLSKNKNRVTYVDQIANTPQLLAEGGLKAGFPVQSLFSFQNAGPNSVGASQFYKADGTLTTGLLTSEDVGAIVFSGGLDPKINVTLINELSYKGFSLNILGVYYGGHFQRALQPTFVTGSAYGSLPSYTLDAWTPNNTDTYIPGYGQYAPTTALSPVQINNSDVFVRPSDFIKIRSVGLGYKLPRELTSKLGGRNVSLRFQLNNPKAVWIKNKVGIDPETGAAPTLTSYVFGLNFNL
ncbi:SusC/RagA family TonB-linked outer membrane protein [Pedobacter africanus]|uniref:TonB-linked outer membrane protein, SusC/RagA family n=1 Tax=Pedobacter africanus TaxID=151894 RepID=A0A1W2AZC4_9SPHI|nr:SusC/RagA family TonB-linked outer membrane protein [Pedobacter africanus]SMC66065.1 TonB-linked outer membrane protein, SusC/RagA family [Pedobacter africanus]